MSRRAVAAALLLTAMAGGTAHAQTSIGQANLDIRDAVQVSTLQRASFADGVGAMTSSASTLVDAVAVIQVSTDPGRSYRVRLPQFATAESRAFVEAMSASNSSADDVGGALGGHTDNQGHDVVRVAGRLRLPADFKGAAATAVPLSVDVE